MGKLYIMCGVPGSGKSTYAKHAWSEDAVKYVSRDKIRFEILEQNNAKEDEYFKYENQVFETFVNQIGTGLMDGFDVVADATHISKGSRYKLLKQVWAWASEVIAVHIDTDPDICKERNAARTGKERVPDEAMDSMIKNFKAPSTSEPYITTVINVKEI